MTDAFKVLALGGDGIGPEVVGAGLELLEAVSDHAGLSIEIEEDFLHGAAYDRYGTFCRDETVQAAKAADAVLVGAVGGPRYDGLFPDGTPAEKDALVRLRQELDVFAGLRPARAYDALLARTAFRDEVVRGADIMVVREQCSGIYFGEPRGIDLREDGTQVGYDANFYTSREIERVVRVGFELAGRRDGRLVSIDKANVMESGTLWRRIATEIGAQAYPDIELTHLYADNALFQLASTPGDFDVIVGDNLFGDLISDMTGAISGSLGMLPSASLAALAPPGERSTPGIYEPVHGSAPDIAGQGIANPIGTLLSISMMFEYAFARSDLARHIESAVEAVIESGPMTPDVGGEASTREVTAAVIERYVTQTPP